MVDTTVPPDQAQAGRVPPDSEVLMSATSPKIPYVVKKQVLVSGGDLTDAQPGFDQRSGEPIVNFRFNTSGSRKFAQATSENVGQPFAIVLDNEVISAPGDPRADHRRFRADFRQLHGPVGQRSGDPAARRRAAGAADRDRGAHRRSGARSGFDREGRTRRLCRLDHGDRVHARDLSPVRRIRQHRGRHQRRHDLRRCCRC